jgi:hypothetical protein
MYKRLLKLLRIISVSGATAGSVVVGSAFIMAPQFVLADTQRTWAQLTQQQQRALAPLEKEWGSYPAQQQTHLLLVAKRFPSLPPDEQRLLQKRLRTWSQLTPQQRHAARQNLQRIQTLPADDQEKIKQRWLDALCKEFDAPKHATQILP